MGIGYVAELVCTRGLGVSRIPAVGREVPFFRVDIGEQEIEEVVAVLRSGWLTTGPRVAKFESDFAKAVGAKYAIAVNSCTAALHLALEALGVQPGEAVLVPTMTFAATAEVVRYMGAVPVLVDCDPITLNMSLGDASKKLDCRIPELGAYGPGGKASGIVPVHVGGLMINMDSVSGFAVENDLWVVEDAAHAFPSAFRSSPEEPWRRCGEGTSSVSCFSFYANKTITTGEVNGKMLRNTKKAESVASANGAIRPKI